MSITDPRTLATLTDHVLVARIGSLTARARESTADLIGHLVELERRNLHLALGYRSLFFYCRSLHFSESESYTRMEVAHVARRFPVVLPLLAAGRLHLTAVRLLGPHLGDEDHLALLGGAFRRSRREIDALLARWFPKADVPATIRKLPRTREGNHTTDGLADTTTSDPATTDATAPDGTTTDKTTTDKAATDKTATDKTVTDKTAPLAGGARDAERSRRSGTVAPLSPARYKVAFTASETTIAKLRRAQELLSHAIPDGDLEAIFDRALDLVIAEGARARHSAKRRTTRAKGGKDATGRKVGKGGNGMDGRDGKDGKGKDGQAGKRIAAGAVSRSIPAEVERVVWERDGGRCAFIGLNGRRCEERKFLEFHHVKPWAAGGPPTVDNIALRCRAHNRYEAERYFGPIRDARSAEL